MTSPFTDEVPTGPTVLEGPPPTAVVEVPDGPPELIDHPRYRVLNQLGAGGMGVVFRAEHRVMGRVVALKVMARRYTNSAVAVERFRREVQAAARLNHPNIVTAHDADEANGAHFLVMEYVEGVSLDRMVKRRGKLPYSTACQCVRLAALGLQHAHDRGMVHRDIKPHNIMVTRKGQVKVLDFGLARLAADQNDTLEGGSAPMPGMTSPSIMLGTPDFVAPEQARNASAVGPAADIYSLGCTLYYLLTGHSPFSHHDAALAKLLAHANEPPLPLGADVPVELNAIVKKMMAKAPGDRFASAADVANALKPFARSGAIDADPVFVTEAPASSNTAPIERSMATEPIVAARPTPRRSPASRLNRKRSQQKRRRARWLTLAALLLVVTVGAIVIGTQSGRRPSTATADSSNSGEAKSNKAAVARAPRRVLFVLPSQALFMPDYAPVRRRLESSGVEVVSASTSLEECRSYALDGTGGRPTGVRPDRLIGDVNPADYRAVIFCGGDASDYFPVGVAGNDVRRILRQMMDTNRWVCGICTGQEVLLRHGALRNRQVARTPFITDERLYTDNGARISQVRLVTSGNFITAAGPPVATEFADAISAAIGE